MTGLGEAGARMAAQRGEAEFERQQITEAATAGETFARISNETEAAIQELQNGASADAAGHTDAVAARVRGRRNEFLGSIRNERVRMAYRGRFAEFEARVVDRERGWEAARRLENIADSIDRTGSLTANRVAALRTPEALEAGLGDLETQAEIFRGVVPEGALERAVRAEQRKIVVAWANAQNASGGHNQLLALLDDPELNLTRYLEPEDVTTLRAGARVEQRREITETRALRAEQEGQARVEIRLFTARITAGDEPTDEEFTRIEGLANQFGLTVEEFNVGVHRVQLGINRETRNWTGPMFEQEIGRLRAKTDRTTDENVRLAHLESIAGSRIQENANDPHGRGARMGNAAPAINLSQPDRGAINQRIAWAESYARQNGLALPPYFSNAEIDQLRERYRGGDAAKLDLAGWLRGTLGSERAEMAARQIAPDDATLRIQVRLAPPFANLYVRGREALGQANNGLLAANNDIRGFGADDARRVFGEVQSAIPQDLRQAYYDAALHIAAGMADGNNQGISEDTFRMALHRAAGATGMPGQLRGGLAWLRGQPVWLPENLNQADFERRIARATPEQWGQATIGATGIHFADRGAVGRAATLQEVRQMRFQTVRPGIYRLVGPQGGVMLNSRGSPYEFDVRRLP